MIQVWLASYPRSGNTFLRHAIESVYGVATETLYIENDTTVEPTFPVDYAVLNGCYRFVKTHAARCSHEAFRRFPAINLVRDGRDALVSHAHFEIGVGVQPVPDDFNKALKKLILGGIKKGRLEPPPTFYNWGHDVLSWYNKPNVYQMKFENLIENPIEEVKRAFAVLNINLPRKSESVATFDRLHGHDPVMFRRGKVGSYKDEMCEEIQHLFMKHNGNAMKLYGYGGETE